MIHPDIINASPVLKNLQPPVSLEFRISETQQSTLLNFLHSPDLPEEIWTDDILYLIDYLLLPTLKIETHYIIHGDHAESLIRNNLLKKSVVSLKNHPESEWPTIAIESENIGVLEYLGFPQRWVHGLCLCASTDNDKIIIWARDNGCPCQSYCYECNNTFWVEDEGPQHWLHGVSPCPFVDCKWHIKQQ